MNSVSYKFTGDEKIPAEVTKNGKTTPVWMQKLWEGGEFEKYIRGNGCGHCCAAMAANLHGVDINPYAEFEYCRKIWGAPVEPQENFMSVTGIAKVLNSLGVSAKPFAVLDKHDAIANIMDALDCGQMVIFCAGPHDLNPNHPFSTGSHWVLAVGYDENGKIVVANSSHRASANGIQVVEPEVIRDALYVGTAFEDRTWGILKPMKPGVGFVVVG